jgi:hypothetical protein
VRISYEEHTVTSRIDFAGAVLSIPKDSTWSELTTHRVPSFWPQGLRDRTVYSRVQK